MKKIVLTVASFLLTIQLNAQAPQGINYQAVVRNASGATVNNSAVGMRISLRQNSATGTVVYSETFSPVTTSLGLVNFVIGQGAVTSGNFSSIDWAGGPYFCEVAADVTGGTNYVSLGAQQLMSVPYALYAATSGSGSGTTYTAGSGIAITGNTISATDASTSNEYQNLSVSGAQLTISNGNTVTLPTGTTYTAGTGVSITGNTIAANDPSAVNELQSLALTGNTLAISDGNSITLPTGTTYTAGTGISISGSTISASDPSITNEIQSLTLTGNTLAISGGNSVTLSGGGTLDQSYDFGGSGLGRTITADSGPVQINGSGSNTAALAVGFTGTGNAINTANTNAANTFSTVQATTNSSTATNSAVFGQSSGAARGLSGEVTAAGTGDAAVRGNNLRTSGGMGVEGVGFNGVSGQTNYRDGYGVFGQNFDLTGPLTSNSVGVGGVGYIGVLGQSSDAVNGAGIASLDNIIALGTLTVSGTKNFRIDHPLDPENKYLNHFSIESDEVLNIYRGTVPFDAGGNAIVQLPDWFDAVNKNASYQLTTIGGYAPVYIAEKIKDGRFVISGGQEGMEVSWAVYAERNDPYLQQNPAAREVEVPKAERNQGQYLRPELYGQPAEKGILTPMEPQR